MVGWTLLFGPVVYLVAATAAAIVVAQTADDSASPAARAAALGALLAVAGLVTAVLAFQLESRLRFQPRRVRLLVRARAAFLVAWIAALLGLTVELEIQLGSTSLRAAAGLTAAAVLGVTLHACLSPSGMIPNRYAAAGSCVYLGSAVVVGAAVVGEGGRSMDAGSTAGLAALLAVGTVAALTVALRLSGLVRRSRLRRDYTQICASAVALLWMVVLMLILHMEALTRPGPLRLAIGVAAGGTLALMVLIGAIGSMLAGWGADWEW
jgi:hypothetical protein